MNLLNNMKVGTRIGLLAALLLLMIVISVLYGLKLTAEADKGLGTVYSDRVIPLKQLKIVSDEYAVNIVDTSHLVRSGKFSWARGLENIQTAKKNIHEELNAYLATKLVTKEQELVRTLKARLNAADKSVDKLQKIIRQNDKEQLIAFVENELYPSIDPVTEIITKLIDVQLEVAHQVYTTAEEEYHTGQQLMFALIGGSVLLAILITFLIGKSITSQLGDEPQNIQHIATRIALGDLDAASRIDRNKSQGVSKALLEINDSLSSISDELKSAMNRIKLGDLRFRGETKNLSGFFAELMGSSNNLAESLVDFLDDIANPISCIDSNQQTLFLNKNAKANPHLLPTQTSRKKCLEFLAKANPDTDYEAVLSEEDLEIINMEMENEDISATYTGISILDDNNNVIGVFEILVDQTDVIGMQKKIAALADKASEISERLANSTVDLNCQVDEASNGAAVQSERTAETATAMEEMNATVLEVAKNAGRAAENTSMTKDKAQMGAEVVGHVVQVIGEVQQQADSLKVDTEEMGRQAEGIGHIIEVISDIADQTNLLALNAAIEAARAGEAGRGFAVVADEVRKLAEKTMTATTEVNDAVNAIQQSSNKNIASTESAVATIAESTRLADQAGEVLNEIVEFSDDSSEQVQSIAAASEQQSATAEEITRSTEEVDRISQETSSSMNSAARSVEEITTMIQELDKLIQAMAS